MKCEDLRKHISSGEAADETVTEALERHLDGCERCRQFAHDVASLRALCRTAEETSPSTPPVLRHRTLWRAREALSNHTMGKSADGTSSLPSRWGQPIPSSQTFAVVVVVISMILLTYTTYQIAQGQDDAMKLPFKLTLLLVVIQNIIAALLMPVVLIWRNRNTAGNLAAFAQGESYVSKRS
jgi:predicted anti-sigma-YlaC factor YlaD